MRSMTSILSESSRLIRAVFLLGVIAFSIISADTTTELNHAISTEAAQQTQVVEHVEGARDSIETDEETNLPGSVVTGVAEMIAYFKCAGEIILSLNISNAAGNADAEDTTGLTYLKCSGKIIISVNSTECQLSRYFEYAGEITVHATNATITAGVTTESLNLKWVGEITASLNASIVTRNRAPQDLKCGRDIIEDIRVSLNSANATRSEDVGFNTASRVLEYMYTGVIVVSAVNESQNILTNQLPKCPRMITMTLEATSATSSEGAKVSTGATTESDIQATTTVGLPGTVSTTPIERGNDTKQSQDAKEVLSRKKDSEANYGLFLTIPICVLIVGLVTYFLLRRSTDHENEPEKLNVLIPMEEGNAGNAPTIGVSNPISDKDIIKDEAH